LNWRAWGTAITFVVSTTSNVIATEITVDASCTLVDAIEAANLDEPSGGCPAGSGRDEIHLTEDVLLSEIHHGTSDALPEIVSEIDLVGHGHKIERVKGAPDMILLTIGEGGFLNLYSINLSRGQIWQKYQTFGGGNSRLDFLNSTISGHGAGFTSGFGNTLNSQIWIQDEGVVVGAVPEYPSVLRDSTISSGPYFYVWGAASITHSHVTNLGGPITFISGGAYYGEPWGIASIWNTTFSGNGAASLSGRVFDLFGFSGNGTSTSTILRNNTVARNDIAATKHALEFRGYDAPTIQLSNNIVAENGAGGDCDFGDASLRDFGGSFDSDASCGPAEALTHLDESAQDNGGTTPTIALLERSTAIGGGTSCAGLVDQRGIPRDPVGCDSGAYEARALVVDLETEGYCPGTISVQASGLTPGAEIVVGTSAEYARTVLQGGPCSGTALGLSSPTIFVQGVADMTGVASFEVESHLDTCADLLQAIDLVTCEISGAATVGVPPPPPPCSVAAKCGRARDAVHFPPLPPPGHVDEYLVGDWVGTGCDSIAARTGNEILFDLDFDDDSDAVQLYGGGQSDDQYLVGDWNNDGCDDIAVRRGNELLMDTDFDGQHDLVATFGPGIDADEYFIGDLDGSGTEAIVFRDLHLLHWDLSPWDGAEDGLLGFGGGENEDQYLIGKWSLDLSTQQTFAVRRGNEVLMNYDLDGQHDFVQVFGIGDEDEYLVGDWDGDGRDNLATRRGGTFEMDTNFDSEPEIIMTFGEGTE